MLDVDKFGDALDEMGFSPVLLRFLTDHERGLLETLVARYGHQAWNPSRDLEQAGRLMYSAHRRAEMRHPGFE
jgi:hypothetical protein